MHAMIVDEASATDQFRENGSGEQAENSDGSDHLYVRTIVNRTKLCLAFPELDESGGDCARTASATSAFGMPVSDPAPSKTPLNASHRNDRGAIPFDRISVHLFRTRVQLNRLSDSLDQRLFGHRFTPGM
jgi:hypothetical protein